MKTPEELFAALGNRGEYAALPHVTLDEVKMIYCEGRDSQRDHSEIYRKETLRWSEACRKTDDKCERLEHQFAQISTELDQRNAVIQKLRLAINEAIANSGGHSPEEWESSQVELCRVLEEVKVMLGEKS